MKRFSRAVDARLRAGVDRVTRADAELYREGLLRALRDISRLEAAAAAAPRPRGAPAPRVLCAEGAARARNATAYLFAAPRERASARAAEVARLLDR